MSTSDEPLIPRIKDSLRPFIKTRQEALRIRRILTLHLSTAILGPGDDIVSPISLAAPSRDVRVNKIPPEFTGVRRDYLLALQANIKARESYERNTQQSVPAAEKEVKEEDHDQDQNHAQHVSTYMDFLQLQKKQQKLQVIQKYLQILRQKDAADPGYLVLDSNQQGIDDTDGLSLESLNNITPRSSESDPQNQELVTRLERAVLRANDSLKRERHLLEGLKARRGNMTDDLHAAKPTRATKNLALMRTRDELISWIEQQLAKVNQAAGDTEAESAEKTAPSTSEIEQKRQEIEETYKDYLEVRRSIVERLSNRNSAHRARSYRVKSPSSLEKPTRSRQQGIREAMTVLPYISENLIPLADVQKSLLQQEGHLSGTLNAQMRAMNRTLDRLADESHLLANYPLIASQPRSERTVTATGGSTSSSPIRKISETEEEWSIIRHAQAWTAAGNAARSAINENLDKRLLLGEQHASAADGNLRELRKLVGSGDEDGDDSDDDLWNPTREPAAKGAWAGLDGNLGVSRIA